MKLFDLTLRKASALLAKKEISSIELTEACLRRIREKNDELNAFITVSEKEALRQAKKADALIAAGAQGVLTGIPYSVKDAILVENMRSTGAAKILDDYIAPYSASVIAKIQEKGGVILGKTNCDAFGHGASNENSHYGPVKNPYDVRRVAGGSSGGAAASVAADMAMYAIAEDTGGSIRQPAAFCGIAGLKVSYGRVSRYGLMPMASSLDTAGPMAKSVWDLAAIMETIAGYDAKDATTYDEIVPRYTEMLLASDFPASELTIGVPKEYFSKTLDKEISDAIAESIRVFQKAGAKIVDVSLPLTEYAISVYYVVVPCEDSANLARLDGMRYGVQKEGKDLLETYAKTRAIGFPDEVKRRIMIGTYALSAGYYDAYYKKAQAVRTLIKKEMDDIFKQVDVLITPVSPFAPFSIGEKAADPLQMYLADIFLSPASVAGVCALSLPCGKDSGGLPIGMQIIGPRLGEATVLAVGNFFEAQRQ
ncbi:MAG: Asp-tRNA(Asn)/Glu-tRNA(Gln) amidotransferase subunit GatA [Parcubacteria group bacterium]|nr:Asp-tRNA(Asn)/Glu-tRNA(Gln) amidotransferase subunit GatA [Parcubacteria group bacterium]